MPEITNTWELYFDGLCEPKNPGGIACYGWALYDPDGNLQATGSGVVCDGGKNATNNVAEYSALIMGLQYLVECNLLYLPLLIQGDSRLVCEQVAGKWKINKPHLQRAVKVARELLEQFETKPILQWTERDNNRKADELSWAAYKNHCAKKGIKARTSPYTRRKAEAV